MSGRKYTTTTISVDELRRLRERAAKATSLQESVTLLNQLNRRNEEALNAYSSRINTLNSNISNLNRRITEQRNAASQEARALREQLQSAIKDSNNRLRDMARANEQRVRRLHEDFTSALSTTRTEFADALVQTREEVGSIITENNRRIESEISQLQGQMNAQIQDVRNRLDGIDAQVRATAHNNGTLLEMAREYAGMAQTLLDDIRTNYRVELLCPGRFKPVMNELQTAQRHIDDAARIPENSSVARLTASSALDAAHRLYQEVILAEQEWQLHYEAARQTVNTAEAQLEASRVVDLAEETGDASVDVDHWTDGDLSSIRARMEALDGQLRKPDGLSLSDLDGIRSAGLQAAREIDDTSMFAVEAFYASQDRGEIAQDIADQLSEFGIMIVDHDYHGNDQRSAHRLHLRNNVTGFELVITQTPVVQEDGTIANRLESDILNYGTTNVTRGDEIARDILSSLSGLGLQQTQVCTEPGFENAASNRVETANIRQWRTEPAPEVVKPDHAARMTRQ